MNASHKILLALAGVLLVSAALSSACVTIRFLDREIPTVGFDNLLDRLHPEWHGRTTHHWQPCFGLCKEPAL